MTAKLRKLKAFIKERLPDRPTAAAAAPATVLQQQLQEVRQERTVCSPVCGACKLRHGPSISKLRGAFSLSEELVHCMYKDER
jgi:hypothetical protein